MNEGINHHPSRELFWHNFLHTAREMFATGRTGSVCSRDVILFWVEPPRRMDRRNSFLGDAMEFVAFEWWCYVKCDTRLSLCVWGVRHLSPLQRDDVDNNIRSPFDGVIVVVVVVVVLLVLILRKLHNAVYFFNSFACAGRNEILPLLVLLVCWGWGWGWGWGWYNLHFTLGMPLLMIPDLPLFQLIFYLLYLIYITMIIVHPMWQLLHYHHQLPH